MTITPIPFPYPFTPMANITGMTYADGTTYLSALEQLKDFINNTLLAEVNNAYADAAAQYAAGISNSEAAMTTFVANFTDELKTINTNAVDGMVADPANPVRTRIQGLIDAAITAVTTTVEAYTDGKVSDLDTALRGVITDLQTAVDADIAAVNTRIDALTAQVNTNGYLFATFTGNGPDSEKLSLFYSPDGKTVFGTPAPAYVPVDGQGVRDPSLIYTNGRFYVAYTSNNGNDKDFHIATSVTGAPGTWTLHTTIDASMIGALEQAWAPEFVQGDDGVYIFFTKVASSKGSMYWVKANNTNLTGWTAPQPVNFSTFPDNWIDGVPVKKAGKWYLFYSDGTGIGRAVADTLTGTYTTDRSGNWNGWGTGVEGPILTKDGDTWRAYFDRYVAGTGYWWSESTDLDNWTAPQQLATAPGTLAYNQTLRHGGMLPLVPEARNKVLAGQFTDRRRHLELYIDPAQTVPKAATTTFTGWKVDSNETTDPTIATYDPATGVITLNVTGGIYRFTINASAPNFTAGVDNVTRAFVQYGMPDGPQTVFLRQSGGVEDIFGLTIPNHHAKLGERVRFQVFCDWNGTATSAAMAPRLKITLEQ